jgi:hypothetical protein
MLYLQIKIKQMHLRFKAGLISLITGSFILVSITVSGQISTGQLGGADINEPKLNAIQTAVPFLTIAPDSRSGAMGDVGAATAPDVNSQHWNIGKYAFLDSKGGFAISYTPWLRNLIPDINLAYLAGFFRVDDQQVITTSLRYFSLGNITFTNIDGSFAGQYNPNEFAIDAGYSRLFTDNFSGGIAFRFIRSDLTSGQTSNGQDTKAGISFAADLGFYYQDQVNVGSSDGEWAAGISLTNMGTPISYSVDADKTPIPTNMRIGGRFTYNIDDYNSVSFNLDLNKLLVPTPPTWVLDTASGEQVIDRGKEPPGSTVFGMIQSFYDAPGEQRSNGNYSVLVEELHEIAYSTGVEYWYREQFAIRTGFFYEHATKGNRKYFTMGVGLKLNVFALDFAYLVPVNGQNSPLANTLRFTLGFDFADMNL